MSADFQTSPPLTQSKVAQGFSTFFNGGIRRSRSLASLQKMAPDDFRSQSSLSVHKEEPETRPKLKTSKTSIIEGEGRSAGRKWIITPIVSSASVFANSRSKDDMRTPSPPARPKPAPHLWDDGEVAEQASAQTPRTHTPKTSLAGLETTIAPQEGSPLSMNPPNGSPFMGSSYTMSPRAQSPRSRASPRAARDRPLANRRKPSVADLALEPMTTVKEHVDSPAYKDSQQQRKDSAESAEQPIRESLTPRATDSSTNSDNLRTPTATSTAAHKSYRRSSMLLPGALAPLLIPNSPKMLNSGMILLPATRYGSNSPVELSASPIFKSPDDEKPPQVPPKSPRTLNRAFPVPRPTPVAAPITTNAPSHTANSSVSTAFTPKSPTSSAHSVSHTANSSVTSISPSELPALARAWSPKLQQLVQPQHPQAQQQADTPSVSTESASAPAVVTSPLPWSMTEAQVPSPRRPLHNQNNFSIDDTVSRNPLLSRAASAQNLHQRNISDSVINRGRPMKRGEALEKRGACRGIKLATIDGSITHMPAGYSRTSAMAALSSQELLSLRQNAEFQASGFETLPSQSVDDLTRELSLLEDHCTTLRRTALSLRESRKALHERLIGFLKAPGNALVSRDHIVKQESSLSELDISIDEWTTKLEAAQERRVKVQRKLLEHVSAVLSLRIPGTSNTTSEEQTPPRSPVATGESEQEEQQALEEQQQALQEQRKRESEERMERLRQIEQMERENAELEMERRMRSGSDAKSVSSEDPDGSRISVESIRIYADNGVASLLASIEKEIDAMDRMRRA